MSVKEALQLVRAQWVERVSHELARGEGVRTGFIEQLERFYELLEQVVRTGDIAWLDPVLLDWGRSSTETSLEKGDNDVSFIMSRLVSITIDVLRNNLDEQDAIEALAVVIPILTQSLNVVIRYKMESRVAHVSSELDKVQRKFHELDRSKSTFISVAAHELKTPLTLIEGYTSMMADAVGKSSGELSIALMLEGIDKGIKRLRQIIDDMIDVSLIDNNLLSINHLPFRVSHLIRLIRNEVTEPIASRNQMLVVEKFEGDTMMIQGDIERLFQALRNVVSNAIKYTPDHGTITLNGRLLPGFVEITIADTGIGIPQEHQSTIFDKFEQVGRSDLHSSGRIKFKGGGPGLGLPIARGIIEAHGGSIWVESSGYDEVKLPGSKFHILLPIDDLSSGPSLERTYTGSEDPKKETDTSAQETTSTNNPPA